MPPVRAMASASAHRPHPKGDVTWRLLICRSFESTDPELEAKAERIGFENSWKVGFERGGLRRIQVAANQYVSYTTSRAATRIGNLRAARGRRQTRLSAARPTLASKAGHHLQLSCSMLADCS